MSHPWISYSSQYCPVGNLQDGAGCINANPRVSASIPECSSRPLANTPYVFQPPFAGSGTSMVSVPNNACMQTELNLSSLSVRVPLSALGLTK